jgi:GH24 family phage-related lysozyme (muramidase)
MTKRQVMIARLAVWRHRRDARYYAWKAARGRGDHRAEARYYVAWRHAIDVVHDYLEAIDRTPDVFTHVSRDVAVSIAEFEGLGPNVRDGLCYPYWDADGGVWTIGRGHVENVGPSTPPITIAEAMTLLEHDLDRWYGKAVLKMQKGYARKLTQQQGDADTSFVYNLGVGKLEQSSDFGKAMRAFLRGAYGDGQAAVKRAADAFLIDRYATAGGRTLAGLVRRRKWEAQLFAGGSYTVPD